MANLNKIVRALRAEGYAMLPSGAGDQGKAPGLEASDGTWKLIGWEGYQEKPPPEAKIDLWLRRSPPSPLWGIVTGKGSGVVIVDTDPGADQTIMNGLEPHVKTPRGGSHYWFERPGKPVKTCAGVPPKIDIRGDGGFANVVGVNPKTGGEYTIEIMPTRDRLYKWEQMPKPLLEAMEQKQKPEVKPDEPIPDGIRDKAVASILGAARRAGANEAELEALAVKIIDRMEQPVDKPWTEEDACRVAKSVSRYPPALSTHLTDTGNAEYMARLYGDKVRYDHSQRRWLLWNGNYWQTDRDGFVSRLAVKAAKKRYIAAAEIKDSKEKEAASRWAIASESKMKVEAALALAKNFEPFADDGRNWDTDTMLLGCENGIVDLRTGELRAGRPEDQITMSTGLDYDAGAACVRWELFLSEVFDFNEELINWLWRALGYSLTGDGTEHVFIVGYGEGANGKTRFLNAICGALGDYAHISPFSTFTMPTQSSTNDLRSIDKKRFVTSSETNEGTRLNTERVKALSGEDPLSARYLYKEFETFMPHCKLWLFVNHKPDIQDDTIATWRRVRLIPFAQTFIKEKADIKLGEKLRAEAQGILAWLVRGCLEWQKRSLTPVAECIRTATGEYRQETDPFLGFLDACCVVGGEEKASAGNLYRVYKRWAKVEGKQPVSKTMFGKKMGKRFERRDWGSGPMYYGVGLAGTRVALDLTEEEDDGE